MANVHRCLKTGICALLLAAPCAFAQGGLASPSEDHFRLSAGLYSVTTNTDLRLDANDNTTGTSLNAEDDLGLRDRSEIGNVEVELRIRERHHVRFNYFRLDRKGRMALDRIIRFGENVYVSGDLVESSINVSNFSTTYSYSFLQRERAELAGSFGITLMEFSAAARVRARGIDEDESQAGPVPALGLSGMLRLTNRLHLEARGEYLRVNINDFEGSFTNLHGALLYRFTPNLGLGLGYTRVESRVNSRKPGDSGRFELGNQGGELFLRVSF